MQHKCHYCFAPVEHSWQKAYTKALGLAKKSHNIWPFASTPHLFVSMYEANCKQPTAITPSARKPADEGAEGPLGP